MAFLYSPDPYTSSPYDYSNQSPPCVISVGALESRVNDLNTSFSSSGYENAKMCCNKNLQLPKWPSSKIYPVVDMTSEFAENKYVYDINTYEDVLTKATNEWDFRADPMYVMQNYQKYEDDQGNQMYNLMKYDQGNQMYNLMDYDQGNQMYNLMEYDQGNQMYNPMYNDQGNPMYNPMYNDQGGPKETDQRRTPDVPRIAGAPGAPGDPGTLKNLGKVQVKDQLKDAVTGLGADLKNWKTLPSCNKPLYLCTKDNRVSILLVLILIVLLSICCLLFLFKIIKFMMKK